MDHASATDRRLDRLLLHHEIAAFNAEYAAALDEQRLSDWAEMFDEDGFYVVISRENAERGWPVGLIYCENRAMIRDRAFALQNTAMFAPRYLRHMIANLAVEPEAADGTIRARASYAVFEILLDRPDARLLQIGVYRDIFRRAGDALRLVERRCIYDNLLVPTALCLPV